jgi:hypothetical protein
VCAHIRQPYGYPPLTLCSWQNEFTKTHGAICDTFVAITWDVGFHVGQEHLHALLSNIFKSSFRRIDIMFTKDDICIVVDIVITDPTWVDLLPQFCTTQGFVTFDAARTKKRSYYKQHLVDQFLFIVMEVFGCLHK